jgi:hypothetical protein
MTTVDAFLTNCRLADGHLVEIGIADRKIAMSSKNRVGDEAVQCIRTDARPQAVQTGAQVAAIPAQAIGSDAMVLLREATG